jgi:hypothetical protein
MKSFWICARYQAGLGDGINPTSIPHAFVSFIFIFLQRITLFSNKTFFKTKANANYRI